MQGPNRLRTSCSIIVFFVFHDIFQLDGNFMDTVVFQNFCLKSLPPTYLWTSVGTLLYAWYQQSTGISVYFGRCPLSIPKTTLRRQLASSRTNSTENHKRVRQSTLVRERDNLVPRALLPGFGAMEKRPGDKVEKGG